MKLINTLCFTFFLFSRLLVNSQNFKDVTIKTTKLSDHIYMLVGAGGNIGISVSDENVFVIDDQFAPLTEKIVAAIREISQAPITYVANTHFHGDHSGGNENMAKFGATIIAHDNVRKRLEEDPKRDGSMNPKEALPVITFNDKMSVHINGEKVLLFHANNAHTDGDTLLYFTKSNVLHTGDTYFKGWYPYIDLKSGGSVNGYIEAVKLGLMPVSYTHLTLPTTPYV